MIIGAKVAAHGRPLLGIGAALASIALALAIFFAARYVNGKMPAADAGPGRASLQVVQAAITVGFAVVIGAAVLKFR